MSKLTVMYLKDTGHVLAALTLADPPGGDEPVGVLVGTGLPVSFIGGLAAGVTFLARDLASVTVDDQPEVVVTPQDYQAVPDPQGQAPPQVKNVGPTGQVILAITASGGATVTVANPLVPAIVVLQKVTPPSSPPTILPPVAVGPGATVVFHTGFAAGDEWNMYAFVQGLPPIAKQILV